jgi:hypothetical protein
MDIDSAAEEFHKKNISEAIIEPSPCGNGWRILFHKTDGDLVALTSHGGTEKLYHTLDHASELLQGAGIKEIRVEESF